MKKVFLLLNIFALCLLASCNKNEFATFDDKDAFVAFSKASYAIAEDGATLSIPVTLASVAGIETSITVAGVDGTAVNGVDYRVKNGGNLTFNAQTRTANVEIEIINRPGEYTGDLSFSLQFSNLGSVNAGFQSTTAITIQDKDHPLSPILGAYSAKEPDFWGDEYSWDIRLEKDSSDETKVWILDLEPYFASYGYVASVGYNLFYGVVNADMTEISVPLNQGTGYGDVVLAGADADYNMVVEGNLIIHIDVKAGTLTIDEPWGVGNGSGWWSGFESTVFTKK